MVIREFADHIKKEMKKAVVGQDNVIELITLAFLSGGHVILEGVPGLAKTLIARTFAAITGLKFSRIQFTPDLMPSDILGTMVYDVQGARFVFHEGPVFTNVLLADEINRASPKTQSALLEVMEESQVTIEGKRYVMEPPYMVLATQNPVEFEGTYPLPEAQLDRFLMKIAVEYPEKEIETDVLKKFRDGFDSKELDKIKFESIDKKKLAECRKEFSKVRVDDSLMDYIMNIVRSTRENPSILLGASTRAGLALMNISRYKAGMDNRDYVIPDDVKAAAQPVLRHRIILQADAEIEGYKTDDVVRNIIENVKVPR
ncbi:MAG: magnesium chelatase [Spirochaetes bacterium GWF1_51_8]|nr:MAG: magnesium chelatase [Spirochaetes bacterium GWF1_51_8]